MNRLHINLPTEILQHIASASTYLHIVFGLGVNKRTMFREGGPGIVLENILSNGADVKCLFEIKKYVLPHMAVAKAVLTKDKWIVARVCILWETRMSHSAFMLSFINQFEWGVEHIQTKSKLRPWILNAMYAATGDLDKINFTIKDPLRLVYVYDNLYLHNQVDLMKHIKDIRKKVDIHLKCNYPQRAVDLVTDYNRTITDLDKILVIFKENGYLNEAIDLYKMYPEKVHTHPMRLLCDKNPENVQVLIQNGIEEESPLVTALLSQNMNQIDKELEIDEERVLLLIKQLNLGKQFHDKFRISPEGRSLILGNDYSYYYPLEYEKMHFLGLQDEKDVQYIEIMTRIFIRQHNQQRRLEMIESKIITDIDIVLDVIIHQESRYDGEDNFKLLRKFIQIHGLQAFRHIDEYKSLRDNTELKSEFWFIRLSKNKCLNYYEYCDDDKTWLFNICADMKFRGIPVSHAWITPTVDFKNKVIYYYNADIKYLSTFDFEKLNDHDYRKQSIQKLSGDVDSMLAPWAYFGEPYQIT